MGISNQASAAIEVRGGTNFSTLISNGDTTPRELDGTDFGDLDVGSTKSVTFQIKAVNATEVVLVAEDGAAWSISSGAGLTTLAPGQTKTFTVLFDPTSAGYKTANITILSSNNFNFKVEGNALGEPEIKVSGQLTNFTSFININDGDTSPRPDDGTAFGTQGVSDGSISHTFEIENTGSAVLDIDSITDDSPDFSISGAPSEVGVNQTKTFTVKFNPTSQGTKTATITIQNNDANEDPFTFEVNGIGEAPLLEVRGGSSQSVPIFNGDTTPRMTDGTDFGTVVAGSAPITNTFEIKNNGNETLSVSLVFEDSNAFSISGAPTLTTPIPAGGTNDFNITLSTTTAGPKYGTVTILSNDPANGTFTFDITAEATGEPEIKVAGRLISSVNYVNINDGHTTPNPTDGTDFGSRLVSDGAISKTFRIENTGNSRLNIDSITDDSTHFSVADVPASVAVNGEQTFTVKFNPNSHGIKTATITIQNDDANEDPFTFTVQGNGQEGVTLVRSGTAFAEEIANGDTTPTLIDNTDFGTVNAGIGSKSNTFRIENTGNSNLIINGIVEDGPAFDVTQNLSAPTVIAPGATRDFVIEFSPISAGSKSATVTVLAGDGNYTFDIKGEASGTATYLVKGRSTSVSPFIPVPNGATTAEAGFGTDFGSHDVAAAPLSHTFQIENTGSAQLTIDDITVGGDHFSISGIPGIVGVNQTQTFTVIFDPQSFGIKQPTVRIFTGGQSEETYSFKVRGVGEAPQLTVFEGPDDSYAQVVNGSTNPPSDSRLNFGPVTAGVATTRVFSLKNTGNQQLIINAVAEDGIAWDLPSAPSGLTVVPVDGTLTFSVRVDPISAGLKTATVSILTSDPDVPTFTFEVTATATGESSLTVLGKTIPVSPFILIPDGAKESSTGNGTEFVDSEVGAGTSTNTFEIFNNGNAKLNITSIIENSPHFSISGAPSEVGVGVRKQFTINFNPTSGRRKTTTVTIISDAPGNLAEYTFDISGIGEAPDIKVFGGINFAEEILNGDFTPSTNDGTDFGLVAITGTSVTQTFRITNDGNETLTILSGISTDANFTLSGVPGVTNPIPAGQSHDFTVTFDAGSPGFDSAIISLQSNDPDQGQYSFTVEGFGTNDEPEITVYGQNSLSIADQDTTPSLLDGTNLGAATLDGGSISSFFTIENTGTGTLDLTNIVENGARFQIFSDPLVPLAPGESLDFEVRYNPNTLGIDNATVLINNNDADEAAFSFSISGEGTEEETPAEAKIRVRGGQALNVAINNGDTSPRRFDGTDVGSIMLGESKERTFRIGNFGDATLAINTVRVLGAPTAITNFPTSLNPGEFGEFTVILAPQTSGEKTFTVEIISNDPDTNPFTFALKGTGVDPVNPLSVTALLIADGNAEITFISDPAKTYQIAYSHDLQTWNRPPALGGIPGDINAQTYLLTGLGDTSGPPTFFIVEEE